jgi:hypothetical protein
MSLRARPRGARPWGGACMGGEPGNDGIYRGHKAPVRTLWVKHYYWLATACLALLVGCGSGGHHQTTHVPSYQREVGIVCVDLFRQLRATYQHDFATAPPGFAKRELETTARPDIAQLSGAIRRLLAVSAPTTGDRVALKSRIAALSRSRQEVQRLLRDLTRQPRGTGEVVPDKTLVLYQHAALSIARACQAR